MTTAVADVYRAFASYPLGDEFGGCEHCVSAEESARLASIDRDSLTVADLNRYAFKAMTTWGEERHFKYFLPRLLELAAEDFTAFNFPEVLPGKLSLAQWHAWPEDEQRAIANFLRAFWLQTLDAKHDSSDSDLILMVLGGLANTGASLQPCLDLWQETRSENAALHLAQLVCLTADDVMLGKPILLWGNPEPQCTELITWLCSEGPQEILGRYRESVSRVFPFVLSQLDGVRASMANR